MWRGEAVTLDGLRPFFLSVYVSKIVGCVSVPGAGRILCEKKKKPVLYFPSVKVSLQNPHSGSYLEGQPSSASPFPAHKHQ